MTNNLPNKDIYIFKILGKKGVNIQLVDPLFYNPDKDGSSNAGPILFAKEKQFEEHFFAETKKVVFSFIVKLPKGKHSSELGETFYREINISTFRKIPELFQSYNSFLQESLYMNHMEKMYSKNIPQSLISFHIIVYLKSRVPQRNFALLLKQLKQLLFDASVKSSNNFSLNDILLNESVVLDDLFVRGWVNN